MTEQEKKIVQDAVRKVRALREVAKESHLSTSRSQSFVLRALPDHLLVEVAEELQSEWTGADLESSTPASSRN